ncbi:MAG TPA: hypothetical protein DCR40_10100 [Prolixibacteraceae bacterium]|uniref:Uncharacterized protein n=1 Tax=candidate division WS6 bacterium GW2011_GWF1_36_8 TaxID=1619098 RepID=A0A0G0IH28_9BACT|nr:MAG: hypothetical protein US29_C0045G0003 [candidate division WS6 bacterium GW2011_GWF1_36_8]KKQ19332.1 MAG: hypothetical protein US34_C0023G0006 [Candidatus Nomurabacteria bacterium GW2011_GWC2_36_9]HAQ19566.1 hypothetical protein [Prolixibacteraceae bacterium]
MSTQFGELLSCNSKQRIITLQLIEDGANKPYCEFAIVPVDEYNELIERTKSGLTEAAERLET